MEVSGQLHALATLLPEKVTHLSHLSFETPAYQDMSLGAQELELSMVPEFSVAAGELESWQSRVIDEK
jgi:hypothetical protein